MPAVATRLHAARSRLRRIASSPFPPGDSKPTILHCAHHKCGVLWIENVLSRVADRYGMRFQRLGSDRAVDPTADIISDQAGLAAAGLANFRGSHMIRDPRDVAVSAYHYHLWTEEEWAHEPREKLGGKSFQEHLRCLDPPDGLAFQIKSLFKSQFRTMARWNYDQPEFLELRYENVIADEHMWFARLFRHYGFSDDAVAKSVAIAEAQSFQRITGRALGATEAKSHLRSGQPGQWREEFTDQHKALFKRKFKLLILLGYETDDNW